jgi:integrase
MARKQLTDAGVAALKPKATRYSHPDPALAGHYVRVTPTGAKTFVAVTRTPDGKQKWTTIGPVDALTVEQARDRARAALNRVRAGLPANEAPAAPPATFHEVAEGWLKRHVRARGMHSETEITRLLNSRIYPAWRDRPFLGIRRSDVVALLDEVEEAASSKQADYVLTTVRAIMNWFATRHDDYDPPVVRGMRRTDPKSRQRARILNDEELRNVWRAAEGAATYGAMVRVALLTAQRREKIAGMRWEDIGQDHEWTIPTEKREKGNAGSLLLTPVAVAIIRAQPCLGPYVFAGRRDRPFSGFSKGKRSVDARLPPMPQWQFHDLRRTARSLMSRAGVSSEIAERVMGHAVGGVEGIYDRHEYRTEKADAIRRLAALIETIVEGR